MLMNSKTVVDFLIQMAENPDKVDEYKINANEVLSTFDFPDNIKSDIISGELENIRRHIHAYKHKPPPVVYGLDPNFELY
jgi:hypothetical protein